MEQSIQHSYIAPRDVRPLKLGQDDVAKPEILADLKRIGYCVDSAMVDKMIAGIGFDAIQPTVTTGSVSTPVQFLQNWLAGNVHVATAARKIDDLVGIATSGAWENEEIVQGLLELTGSAQPYGDYTNLPLSSWNINFERRTVVRFEEGMRVGVLEESRAAAMRVNSGQSKRDAATLALEIQRNKVGFNGYNSGNNRTYGFLNDPNLPAYVSSANGVWSAATFLQMQQAIVGYIQGLRNSSQDLIDPDNTPMTLAVATASRDYMAKTSDFGISVMKWLNDAYPNIRVVSAPELNAANGGANVAYLYAEKVANNGTDDGATFVQVVPARFIVTGVSKDVKGYSEGYSNATAGVMCKRPFAVYRATGI